MAMSPSNRLGLRVLYTSGYTDNALLKQGMLDTSKNFLAKPYTLAKMAERIRATLDRPALAGVTGPEGNQQ